LLSRNGRVRCGQCKQIFDGLLSATTLEEFQAVAGMAAPDGAAQEAAPNAVEDYWPALPEVPEVPVPPMPLEVAAAASPAYLPEEPAPGQTPLPGVADIPVPPVPPVFRPSEADERDFAFDESENVPPKRFNWRWAIAAAFAAMLLAGQVLYRFRSEMAAHYPALKPALVQLCLWARCSVPPLQQPAALNIEASDLQVIDKAQPHLVQLTATLRNRATITVGYPAFDLVLTDSREHALARRVIVPVDYLAGPQAAQAAIAPNAEVTVRVDMDIGGLPAAGFRLNLAPAPSH